MKKIIVISVLLVAFFTTPVYAKNVRVEALETFSTMHPSSTWSVRIKESFVTKNGFPVYAGSIVNGNVENVTDPKRLKRNASFVFVPMSYYDIKTGKTYSLKNTFVGKYSNMTDVSAKSVAKQGALFVGNQMLDGFLGPGIAVAEGLIKNEKDNRAKSVVVNVYEKSPLSYCNKGKELEIFKGQEFVMNFKKLETIDNAPNYSYTLED